MANESGQWIMYGVKEDDPECLHTIEEAIDYINHIGFLPLFKNDIPGFSLEERTVSDYWWSGDARDPWERREIIARKGEIAYGKFFDKKAGFISKKWFPYFANLRRDGYDFDARWDDGFAPIRQKKIMDLFEDDTTLYSFEIKKNACFGKDGEKNFEGTITELQRQLYLCAIDFRKRKNKKGAEYGWPVAVYAKPEYLYGYDYVSTAYSEKPEASYERIRKYLSEVYPIATDKQVKKVIR